ncbi:hypothetical protein [Nafulsella turpanensis]|uniref:hypothetical protein n=1 Tax=Nafulsella turpanensis TaxID=1265690 RepID=UPI00036862B7|nr:hypothetical protein [Nafulsella turpanensis]
MKKKLLYGGGILLSGLMAAALLLQLNTVAVPVENLQEVTEKTSWTPLELFQKEMKEKGLRKSAAGYAKADKPDEYTKFHQAIRTRWGEEAPAYKPGYRYTELQRAKQSRRFSSHNARTSPLEWVERGPANVPGRTRAILVLPGDPDKNTWLAGSVAGGIWKTEDGGESWSSLTPELANMATTTLVSSKANPDVIYAGTGESFAGYNGVNGDGIFKSVDGGTTWNQLGSTANNDNFRNINRIIVDQANENELLAITSPSYWGNGGPNSKIMKSADGGQSWKKVYEANSAIEHIIAHPDNFAVQYASINGVGVIKSKDRGETWAATGALTTEGRIELAIAPSNPNRLYALTVGSASGTGSDLFTSADAGASWELVVSLAGETEYDYLGGQGWYDNTIAVNPYNDKEAYLGGVNLFRVQLGAAGKTEPAFLGVREENTDSFLSFVNFGQKYFGGALQVNENLPSSEIGTVEVRFGSGRKQKAHRFTVPQDGGSNSDGGAGIPDSEYTYQDYVEVPFQVWDITHNRQLMVSFRDQERDGKFNLKDRQYSDEQMLDNREYLYIHAEPYAETAHAQIAMEGGQVKHLMYFTWPTLTEGSQWNPTALPDSKLVLEYGEKEGRDRTVTIVADAYGTLDGPNGFSQQTNQSQISGLHPDHHNITMVPVNELSKTFKIIVGNDGGVYVSNVSSSPGINDGDWTFAGNGYNTTQFYGIDKMPGKDAYIGGTQDNGTWRSSPDVSADAGTKYFRALGGDGFEVVWNYDDPNKMMGTLYYNSIYRTVDGGKNWSLANTGISDKDADTAPFITKLASHKSKPNVVFAVGKEGVWRTENFGGDWTVSPISENWFRAGYASFLDVEVSEANPNVVWAGFGMIDGVANLHVSVDGGKTFKMTSNFSNAGVITGLYSHPTEDSTAYALFSYADYAKILRTTDLGNSWHDISGFGGVQESTNGFPDVAVYSLLVMPHEPDRIWAGTEIGLVESTDGGNSWSLANNGLPNVPVWDMKVVDDQVVIGTHARGIWTVTFPEIPPVIQSPLIKMVSSAPSREILINLNLRSPYDSLKVVANGTKVAEWKGTTVAEDSLFRLKYRPEGEATVNLRAVGYEEGIAYESALYFYEPLVVGSPVASYSTDFSEEPYAFKGNGFTFELPSGFRNTAMHSKHFYERETDYTAQFNRPVIVDAHNALVRYRDIAVVEAGLKGASFGEEDFKDYVVVEGSKDGIVWTALEPGYDASQNADWQDAARLSMQAEQTMFVPQEIDLHQTYTAGDTILIRFRLHSNENGVAYGWVIDDVEIQANEPLGFMENLLLSKFTVEVYPNPLREKGVLHWYMPEAGQVYLEIIDLQGRVLESRSLGYRNEGEHLNELTLSEVKQGQLVIVKLRDNKGNEFSVRVFKI